MQNTTFWSRGEGCPYGKVCEQEPGPLSGCPAIELDVPADLEADLNEKGMYVMGGYRPEHPHLGLRALNFASVRVCNNALEDPAIFDIVAELEAVEIDLQRFNNPEQEIEPFIF